MPENKEPRFFCNYPVHILEFGKKYFHADIISEAKDYLRLYEDAPAGAICGEASTDYLSSAGTDKRIRAWNSDTKIIVMLRDPIERAYSEYRHSIVANFQHISFWESLCREDERYNQWYDPIFFHVRRGLYSRRVEEYIKTFGRGSVRVLFFEDFKGQTAETVGSVFEFLGLEAWPVDVSTRYNADIVNPPKPRRHKRRLHRLAIKVVGRDRAIRLFRIPDLDRYTTQDPGGARGALSRDQYEALRLRFVEDVERLEHVLGVDLGHWLRPYDDGEPEVSPGLSVGEHVG